MAYVFPYIQTIDIGLPDLLHEFLSLDAAFVYPKVIRHVVPNCRPCEVHLPRKAWSLGRPRRPRTGWASDVAGKSPRNCHELAGKLMKYLKIHGSIHEDILHIRCGT